MKVILKQRPITIDEAIIVNDENCKILVETPILKQKLYKEEDTFVLYEESIDKNDVYESIGSIKVYCKEGDLLLYNGKGYTKPLAQYIELNEKQEETINKLNELYKG